MILIYYFKIKIMTSYETKEIVYEKINSIENTIKDNNIDVIGNINVLEFIVSDKTKEIVYEKILNIAENNKMKHKIVLLKNRDILDWLTRDFAFLNKNKQKIKKSKMKELEDDWGKKIVESILKKNVNKMWSGVLGEEVCKELFAILDYNVSKPKKMEHIQPDLETDCNIVEIKNATYFTGGTANEKISGIPYKYRDVYNLYKKPLLIVCLGQAEIYCRDNGLLFGNKKQSESQKEFIDFFNKKNINFIGSLDLINMILNK